MLSGLSTPNKGALHKANNKVQWTNTSPSLHPISQDSKGEPDTSIPSSISHSQVSKGDMELTMPPIINLEMAGLRRSPRIADLEAGKKKSSFVSIITKICDIGILLSTCMTGGNVFSESQASVNGFIHQCNVVNANFDGTLNHIHHMVLATGKENNEVYTFKEMLQQDDAKDFI